jgi:hypothetical protein
MTMDHRCYREIRSGVVHAVPLVSFTTYCYKWIVDRGVLGHELDYAQNNELTCLICIHEIEREMGLVQVVRVRPRDLSFEIRMDRQGIVHRWLYQSSLCDPDYHVMVVFKTNTGFFEIGKEPNITCLLCIGLEAKERAR